MDYCRMDMYDGRYIYLKNDSLSENGTYRSKMLKKRLYYYQRIRRLATLPDGKKVNHWYDKTERN